MSNNHHRFAGATVHPGTLPSDIPQWSNLLTLLEVRLLAAVVQGAAVHKHNSRRRFAGATVHLGTLPSDIPQWSN
jgi:hypothetical protein